MQRMNTSKAVLIVAGGKGERMQSSIPKQFIEIQGKPILMHTIEVFYRFDPTMQLVVVLSSQEFDAWRELCVKHSFVINHTLVAGGKSRFFSVKNGLDAIKKSALVAVHDGVRPLVSTSTIQRCFEAAEAYGAAIPVVELVDSIRKLTPTGSVALNRVDFKRVQTPQIFDVEVLRTAYDQQFSPYFTDDASVVESLGMDIHLVQGNDDNVKITTELDVLVVEALLQKRK
jgi:2-C-methyl-D-erythritol 4-phosphate cytidylyltransferase